MLLHQDLFSSLFAEPPPRQSVPEERVRGRLAGAGPPRAVPGQGARAARARARAGLCACLLLTVPAQAGERGPIASDVRVLDGRDVSPCPSLYPPLTARLEGPSGRKMGCQRLWQGLSNGLRSADALRLRRHGRRPTASLSLSSPPPDWQLTLFVEALGRATGGASPTRKRLMSSSAR